MSSKKRIPRKSKLIPRDSKLGNTIAHAVAAAVNVALEKQWHDAGQRAAREARCVRCRATFVGTPNRSTGALFDDHTCLDPSSIPF